MVNDSLRISVPLRKKVRRAYLLPPLELFLAGHVVLGIALKQSSLLAMFHALGCVAVGVFVALTRSARDVALVVAYITGSEVVWRMTHAGVFHEIGKYSVALILLIAVLRIRTPRNRVTALAYFALLLPSAVFTLSAMDLDRARRALSFNLSGPLALTMCVIFFSNLRLSGSDVRRVFFALIGPVVAMSTIIFVATSAIESIDFSGESNFETSGGFGPNQVSASLGLALMFTVLMLFEPKQAWRRRVLLLALASLFAVQAALTFSRGGIAFSGAGLVVAMAYLTRDRRRRLLLLGVATVCFGIASYVIVPKLDEFTHGKLADRYSEANTSGRADIANIDIEIFKANPTVGVGPGVAPAVRQEMTGRFAPAHTEFSRLLAEHGVLGLLSMFMLVLIGVRALRRARTIQARAFVIAMLVWVALFLSFDAMRVVAPSFLFAFASSISFSSTRPATHQPRTAARS